MTELEKQLAAALETLSAQSARERQRDAEQIEALQLQAEQQAERTAALQKRVEQQAADNATLRRQFERLDGQSHSWPRTTGRSPRRCAGPGRDAPARPGAGPGSRSEPLMVHGGASAPPAKLEPLGKRRIGGYCGAGIE